MKSKTILNLAAAFILLVAFHRAEAQLSFSVTDLGTLGGTTSTANSVAAQGTNAAGMIVGSSTTSDNAEHAFLFAQGQMFDLNTLCDLATSDFRVLTVARAINDSCVIIGEGITTNGSKHAFMLTPLQVAGGQWSYLCCQWVWMQQGGGWWWEESCGCYRWHGPPGDHPPCPPEPPPCWWFPLPCPPPCHRPTPTPTPPYVTPTPPTRKTPTPTPPTRQTPTPPNWTPPPVYTGSPVGVMPTPTPPYTGVPVGVMTTPTPTLPPAVRATATPSRRIKPKQTPTGTTLLAKPTPTPGTASRSRGTRNRTQFNANQAPHGMTNAPKTKIRRTKVNPTPKPTPR